MIIAVIEIFKVDLLSALGGGLLLEGRGYERKK
jgi:hypothetical protein